MIFISRTWPPLNILLYNTILGSGDQLYGVEPISYYIKALILNTGVAFPLSLFGFICTALSFPSKMTRTMMWSHNKDFIIIHLLILIWLALLFSRPHKVLTSYLLYLYKYIIIFVNSFFFKSNIYIPLICLIYLGREIFVPSVSFNSSECVVKCRYLRAALTNSSIITSLPL